MIKEQYNRSNKPYKDTSNMGEVLVFTGALQMSRREAADMAAQVGFKVASSVTKQTTILVVGKQDASRLIGHEKSLKHRQAEKLIYRGYPIRIIWESDFIEFVSITLIRQAGQRPPN